MPSRVRKYLKYSNGIGLLIIETVAAIDRSEVPINPEAIQHGTTEVHRLVGQHGQAEILQPIQRFADARIQHRTIEHVCAVVGQEQSKRRLQFGFGNVWPQSLPDQILRPATNETGDLLFAQCGKVELLPARDLPKR